MVRTKMVGEDHQREAALKSHVTPLVPKVLNYSRLDQALADFSSLHRAAMHLV